MTLNKEIFRIAIPNIIANISIPLLGIVDTALMGRMDDPAYIGAIALGGVIFNILYWGLGFLRPGTTGLTAQSYGKGNIQECYRLLFRSSIIGFGLGLLILIFHQPLGHFCFNFLSGTAQVESLGYEYFSIRVLAAPAVICIFALRGWFFGMQDAVSPMILTITSNVLNIIFSWYLVMTMDMSVAGVAYGTLAAQLCTFVVAMTIIALKYKANVIKYFDTAVFKAQEMLRFLSINRDMFIRNLCMITVFSFFTDYSSQIDNDYLAINQMLLQLFYFMAYSVDGFAYASESLVGKYLGAQSLTIVKDVIKKCLIYGLAFGAIFSIGFIISGESILRLMTTNVELINESQPYFIWLALVSISGALAFIWDGVFSGATAAKELRDSIIIATIFFFIVFYITKTNYPFVSIWAAMVAFMLGRSIFQIILYKIRIEKLWKTNSL